MQKPTPKKPDDSAPTGPRRQRLPQEPTCPALSKVRVLLEQAEAQKGCLIELPWLSTDQKNFILTVQWDSTQKDPVWTLYEENDSGSKVVWTQPFAAQDLEFMYDILSMSAGSSPSGLGIPDELKMKPSVFEEEKAKEEPPAFDSYGAPSLSPFGNTPTSSPAQGGMAPPAAPFGTATGSGFSAFPTPGSSYTNLPSLQPGAAPGYRSAPQQFLYFLPLPQGQGSLRPTRGRLRRTGWAVSAMASLTALLAADFAASD